MKDLKNIAKIIGLLMWLVGAFGGFGYAWKIGEYFTAVCCLTLGAMAFPTIKGWYSFLRKKNKEQEK